MAKRKYIRWKTWAAAVLASACPSCGFRYIPYEDAKKMTEDQFLSLFHRDHNILHESGHPDRDAYWNLGPLLIKAHREKTRRDATVIAKSRRIRAWNAPYAAVQAPTLRTGPGEFQRRAGHGAHVAAAPRPARRLRSRGFNKTLRRKMDGTVVRRDET